MDFMLTICVGDSFRAPKTTEPEVTAWVQEMKRRGVRKSGNRFRPIKEAKTVRVRDGKTSLTRESITTTEDHIAGYELLDCKDMEEAIKFASSHPMAKVGTIEIRQIWI